MKILIDMNLSPTWTDCLEKIGIEATHWSKIGPADAPDSEIMKWASHHGYAVFTHDLDFGALLYLTVAHKPSVIQIRAEDVRPVKMMKNWNRPSVLGSSDLFFHHFTLDHFT